MTIPALLRLIISVVLNLYVNIFNDDLCLPYSLIFPGVRLGSDSQFSDFLDGLGPAQLVGRQTLATPSMGMLYLFFRDS